MAITLAVTESYCTIDEADAYLENNTAWNAATDKDKTDALLEARYYIDVTFECDLSEETVIPDALKYATAILAAEAISSPNIFDSGPVIQKERSKADVVEVEKEYFVGSKNQPAKLKQVQGILQSVCTRVGLSTSWLLRS